MVNNLSNARFENLIQTDMTLKSAIVYALYALKFEQQIRHF